MNSAKPRRIKKSFHGHFESWNKQLLLMNEDVRIENVDVKRTKDNVQLLWNPAHEYLIFYTYTTADNPKPYIEQYYQTDDPALAHRELKKIVSEYISEYKSNIRKLSPIQEQVLAELEKIEREGQTYYNEVYRRHKNLFKNKTQKRKRDEPTNTTETDDLTIPSTTQNVTNPVTTSVPETEQPSVTASSKTVKKSKQKKSSSKNDPIPEKSSVKKQLLGYEQSRLQKILRQNELRVLHQSNRIHQISMMTDIECDEELSMIIGSRKKSKKN
jgi:hypothetical protein